MYIVQDNQNIFDLHFKACDCNRDGSILSTCDGNGVCQKCRNNVIGEKCDECDKDMFGFPNCRHCKYKFNKYKSEMCIRCTYFQVDEDEREELLFKSIKADDFQTIKSLVRLDTDIESREPEHNETSLLYAVRHGQCAIARWLLEKGADVSAANEFESTAIHIAAEVGNVWCLQDLIGQNADINQIDDWGYTPLDVAKYWDNKYAYSYLISRGAKCKACCHKRFGVPC